MLKPCQYRSVTDQGQLSCVKISGPDKEVSPDICAACPVSSLNCAHLRFALQKRGGGDILVRFGNGRSEVWKGEPEGVRIERAACAELAIPVTGLQMCPNCALRLPAMPDAETVDNPARSAAAAGGKVVPLTPGR